MRPTGSRAYGQLLSRVLRFRWLLLLAWAGVSCASNYWASSDWMALAWGGRLLFGSHPDLQLWPGAVLSGHAPGGIHLFANYHVLQTGPLTLVLARGLSSIGSDFGYTAAVALIELIGVGCLFLLERIAIRSRGKGSDAAGLWIPLTTLLGGFVFLQVWSEVSSRWGHLDDALAVGFGVLAVWAVQRQRPILVGVVLGLAVASKPWALGLTPLVFVFKGRQLRIALAALGPALVLPWAPFLIGDPHTVQSGNFPIFVQPAAPVTALGVHTQLLHHTAIWRLVQFAAEGLAVLAVLRWRLWGAALLACFAVRLLLDPMSFSYYQASFAAAAIAFDLLVWRRSMPIATLIAGFSWVVSTNMGRGAQPLPALIAYLAALGLVVVAVQFARTGKPVEDRATAAQS